MEKCVGCQFYDRGNSQADARGIQWGQCRRSAPRLHPVNQKTFMIEGVWPHVRDDDWCGEWKAAARRPESRQGGELSALPLGGLASAPARAGGLPGRADVLTPAAAGSRPPGSAIGLRPASGASVSAFNASAGSMPATAIGATSGATIGVASAAPIGVAPRTAAEPGAARAAGRSD